MYGLVLENLSAALVYILLPAAALLRGFLYTVPLSSPTSLFSAQKFSLLFSFAILALSFYSSYCMYFKVGSLIIKNVC